MKISGLLLLLIFCAGAGNAQTNSPLSFTLTVDVAKLAEKPADVILQYKKLKNGQTESIEQKVKPVNNKAVFKGLLDEPLQEATVRVEPGMMYASKNFYLQPGNLKVITAETMASANVEGKYQNDLDSLQEVAGKCMDKFYNSLTDEEKNVTSDDEKKYVALMTKKFYFNNAMLEQVYKPFIIAHPENAVSVYALQQYSGDPLILIRSDALSTTDSLYHLLDKNLQQTPTAMEVKKRIDAAERVSIGKLAPNFIQPDTSGKMVALSSFKGKYVLIDFWASWCHWCRVESPGIIALFNKYNNKNFEVLSVSLDVPEAKTAWLNAIRKDGTGIWAQVCELSKNGGADNTAAQLYGIGAIPQNILINPQGIIVGVNLHEQKLKDKLAQLFE